MSDAYNECEKRVLEKCVLARKASKTLSSLSSKDKNNLLSEIASELISSADDIISENEKDILAAREAGISDSMIDRLMLNKKRIEAISQSIEELKALDDPIGEILEETKRTNGLIIRKKRVPFGVLGIIYEARPNVTVDAAAICLKTSNACVLRGGKEAIRSNIALVGAIKKALIRCGIDENAVSLIEDTSRDGAVALMTAHGYVDMLIPRGGKNLIASVVKNATVPVIETGTGNCHIFVDSSANEEMAADIIVNAKTSRPSVCNACETMLVHKDIAESFLPKIEEALREKKTEIRGCPKALEILGDKIKKATDEDFDTEFLDYIIALKVVGSVDEAIEHIDRYSTRHSEAIITESAENAEKFLRSVDAAAVYVNASTRFTDGGEFGLGAEIGISTSKLHARGPMGLKEMTTYKYEITGTGQIR